MSLRAAARLAVLSPRRRMLAGVAAVLVLALLIVGGLRAWQAMHRPAGVSTPALKPGDVLLVPGYGGSIRSLFLLAAGIRATGRAVMIVRLPGNGTSDLEVQARALNGYVNRALRAGTPSVDVVGYSSGGVVARLWDVEYDGAKKARRVITLGSPLHGAQLAALAASFGLGMCPPACEQLVPGSALLGRLQRPPLTGRPAWLSLWTDDDQVVRPPESARLAGAVNVSLQRVCPGAIIQHGQLPSDPLVIGIVLRALGTGPLKAPNSADCGSLRALGMTAHVASIKHRF